MPRWKSFLTLSGVLFDMEQFLHISVAIQFFRPENMRTDWRLTAELRSLVLLHWSLPTSAPLQPSRWRPSELCPTWRCCWRPTAATSPSCRACFLAARATWTVCWVSSWRPSSSTRGRSPEPAASKARRDPAPPCSHRQWRTWNDRFRTAEYRPRCFWPQPGHLQNDVTLPLPSLSTSASSQVPTKKKPHSLWSRETQIVF